MGKSFGIVELTPFSFGLVKPMSFSSDKLKACKASIAVQCLFEFRLPEQARREAKPADSRKRNSFMKNPALVFPVCCDFFSFFCVPKFFTFPF